MPGTRTPIAFPLRSLPAALHAPESTSPGECIRVSARALVGMQKEAFVSRGRSAPAWRLLCDEGPYLDGSDLAPPPLAYFAAGMAAHHAALILEDAQGSGLESGEWSMLQETRYTMEGSALRGTMKGGALPTGLTLVAGTGDAGTLQRLAEGALRQSVAEALMATAFSGVFSIRHNGTVIRTGRVPAASDSPRGFHPRLMDEAEAAGTQPSRPAVIRKLESVEPSTDPTHGQGASLRESQKRTLHLRTTLRAREDGLLGAEVRLLRPLGSTFRFLAARGSTPPAKAKAPRGLDYLAAGIALCFMTQMGRYATITRRKLAAYAVLQDMVVNSDPAEIRTLASHAWVESDESDDTVRRIIDMSEQTCFLHASCRSSNPSRIHIGANGEATTE